MAKRRSGTATTRYLDDPLVARQLASFRQLAAADESVGTKQCWPRKIVRGEAISRVNADPLNFPRRNKLAAAEPLLNLA